ncbi:hypothetical protein POREN0001_1746 [Porphyromonas endodontalis ATCC 35406]|uniref:Uncharacterized protein n=1 Tax=Porphyromonas endodontalis (strain ATCC 35406 / DSM 24491 / JCM 8526 / CCUG 16442 / BCRC 14492 / NCTC 13058 / HG 370) TaxID=553175 RepID=C3JBL2_POREA|nr:hypothetical protein POREN0001_1746 [Porphyromonas endodontalis ATCC 35406]
MGDTARKSEFCFLRRKRWDTAPKAHKIPSPSLGLVADYQRLYHK